MKVAWNTCDKEFGGEITFVNKNLTDSKFDFKISKNHCLLEKFK